jgi:threonyl-tRNA synthetase
LEISISRTSQVGSPHFDSLLPQRLDVVELGASGGSHHPMTLHRVNHGIFGRFIFILTEHQAGRIPLHVPTLQVAVPAILPSADVRRN